MLPLPSTATRGVYRNLPIEEVHFGPGCIGALGSVLDAHGARRALVVTGRSIAGNATLMGSVRAALGDRLVAVFGEADAHVPRRTALAAAEAARAAGADALVSVGGGSPNDTAKAAALALAEDIREPDGFDRSTVRFTYPSTLVVPPLTGTPLPLFAVPTTLSVAEFTHYVGITDEERRVKDLCIDRGLTARAVFLDPEMTLHTPEWLWLSSGVRAIDHCVETLCSTTAQPFTDALARHALGLLFPGLRACKADPADLSARGRCQTGAWLSIVGLGSVTLGLSHGIGHQLGARCGVAHGHTSCVMLPAVMAFNREATRARQAWIAEMVAPGEAGGEEARAAAAAAAVLRLVRDELGLPWRLRDVGVRREDFAAIAADSMRDMIIAANPRPVASPDDILDLLGDAW